MSYDFDSMRVINRVAECEYNGEEFDRVVKNGFTETWKMQTHGRTCVRRVRWNQDRPPMRNDELDNVPLICKYDVRSARLWQFGLFSMQGGCYNRLCAPATNRLKQLRIDRVPHEPILRKR